MASDDTRLSQIATAWNDIWQAQNADRQTAMVHAQWSLLERYGGAVNRYLLGAVRDPELAHDLAQEFAVAFLDGAVNGANPEKGRFREYLKGVLRNLIRQHHRRRQRSPVTTGEDTPEQWVDEDPAAELDRTFVGCWRADLLARCWQQLLALEQQSGQPFHTVLKSRAEHPDLPSEELARVLSARLDRVIAAPAARKALQRAREKFAAVLLDELRGTLHEPTPEILHEELMELGLYEYCRPILERADT